MANYAINLDSCGEYSLRTWSFLTPLHNLQMHKPFTAAFTSEE
jgi:hypothetical protein